MSEVLPYANIGRSLKENIYSYSLQTKNSKIEVFSEGKQACRFDKINGKKTLIVNDLWDYNSLLLGNYQKNIPSEKKMEGKIVFRLH